MRNRWRIATLVLVAGRDCAYLRWADAQTSLPGYQPLAGGCATRPSGTVIETFGQPVLVMRFEALTRERLDEIREIMESWLRAQGVAV